MRLKPNMVLRWRTLLMVYVAILLFSITLNAQTTNVIARDAWVRVPLPSKTETALFMVLENHSPQARAVVSVSSDAAATAEMHQMTMIKMTMVMTQVSKIGIPANGKTALDPNGFHIMLFGLKMRPAVGDKIDVTLKLDDGTTVPVEATVRK